MRATLNMARDAAASPTPVAARPSVVTACIEASPYLESVCDHAVWFASRGDLRLQLLQVSDPPPQAPPATADEDQDPLERARERLASDGVEPAAVHASSASLSDFAAGSQDELLVLGRRRQPRTSATQRIGVNVARMIRLSSAPLCLAPRVFLPISYVTVICDSSPLAVDFAAELRSHPLLEGLTLSFTRLDGSPVEPAAAETPGEPLVPGQVFSLAQRPPGHRPKGCDLLVVPRRMLRNSTEDRIPWRLLRSRLPVLVI